MVKAEFKIGLDACEETNWETIVEAVNLTINADNKVNIVVTRGDLSLKQAKELLLIASGIIDAAIEERPNASS